MKSIITNCFIFLILVSPCLVSGQQTGFSFTSSSSLSSDTNPSFLHFSSSVERDRVYLNWTVLGNEDTNLFEIEKSSDGTNFKTAAIFFGTDKAGEDNYKFYEKNTSAKTYYRLKLVQKDKGARYSPVIVTSR